MIQTVKRVLALPWLGGVLEWSLVFAFGTYMYQRCAQHFPEAPRHVVMRAGQAHTEPDLVVVFWLLGFMASLLCYAFAYLIPMGSAGFSWAPHRTRHLLYHLVRWPLQLALLRMHISELVLVSMWIEPLLILLVLFWTKAVPVLQREMRSLDHSYKDTIA